MRVSVDTLRPGRDPRRGRAGAELVLSVNGSNIDVARDLAGTGARVVVVPDLGGGLDTLEPTLEKLERSGVPYLIDPILEPIGFGFMASLERYAEVRRRYPDAEMLMGIGNLTELTAADSTGVNALLIAVCQELGIRAVLTTEVIPVGARRGARSRRGAPSDALRRHAAHDPKGVDDRLVTVKDPVVLDLHGGGAARAAGGHHRSELPHLRRPRRDHRAEQRALRAQARTSRRSSRSSTWTNRRTPSIWARSWRAPASPSRWARPTARKARCPGAISRRRTMTTREHVRLTQRASRADATDEALDSRTRLVIEPHSSSSDADVPLRRGALPAPDPARCCERLEGLAYRLWLDSAARGTRLGRFSFLTADPVVGRAQRERDGRVLDGRRASAASSRAMHWPRFGSSWRRTPNRCPACPRSRVAPRDIWRTTGGACSSVCRRPGTTTSGWTMWCWASTTGSWPGTMQRRGPG